jgi:hypothetical protein
MTKSQILKLRPTFDFPNGMSMVDWFEITEGKFFFCIYSGLKHADGVTKSPYHCEISKVGRNAKKEALEEFSNWFKNLKVHHYGIQ